MLRKSFSLLGYVFVLLLPALIVYETVVLIISPKTNLDPRSDAAAPRSVILATQARSLTQNLRTRIQNGDFSEATSNLAKERQIIMSQLAATDPGAFLQSSLPTSMYTNLPRSLQPFVEHQIQANGKLTHSIAEDLDQATQEQRYKLNLQNGEDLQVFFAGEQPKVGSNLMANILGTGLNNYIVARTSGLNLNLANPPHVPESPQTIDKKIAVILIDFQNNHNRIFTRNQIASSIFSAPYSVNKYYQEITFGQINLVGKTNPAGDVFDWITVPFNDFPCNIDAWAQAALTQLTSSGYNMQNYDHYVFTLAPVQRDPNNPPQSCWWGGLGELDGHNTWWNLRYTDAIKIVGHELGHNLGLNHANTYVCTNPDGTPASISTNCRSVEYADPFDLMSNRSANHLSSTRKRRINVLTTDQQLVVTQSGNYQLKEMETGSAGVKLIRIPRDVSSSGAILTYYDLEYRRPFGFDSFASAAPVVNGISIRLSDNNTWGPTFLIDTTPSDNDFNDSALLTNQVFSDLQKNINIRTLSTSPDSALINVSFTQIPTPSPSPSPSLSPPPPTPSPTPSCQLAQPQLQATPSTATANAQTEIRFTVRVTNQNSTSCPPEKFDFSLTPPNSNWKSATSPYNINLSSGQSADITVFLVAPVNSRGIFNTTFKAKPQNLNYQNQTFLPTDILAPPAPDLDSSL